MALLLYQNNDREYHHPSAKQEKGLAFPLGSERNVHPLAEITGLFTLGGLLIQYHFTRFGGFLYFDNLIFGGCGTT